MTVLNWQWFLITLVVGMIVSLITTEVTGRHRVWKQRQLLVHLENLKMMRELELGLGPITLCEAAIEKEIRRLY